MELTIESLEELKELAYEVARELNKPIEELLKMV